MAWCPDKQCPDKQDSKDEETKGIGDRGRDDRFENWIKASLCLQYTAKSLAKFVQSTSAELYVSVKNNITSAVHCDQCTSEDISQRSVNCGKCMELAAQLRQLCKSGQPTWKNTTLTEMKASHINVAKLFMPPHCRLCESLDQDTSALLSFMADCNIFSSIIQNVTIIDEVRTSLNDVMHSGTMRIDKQLLQKIGNSCITLLTDQQQLKQDQDCRTAVSSIQEVIDNSKCIDFDMEENNAINEQLNHVEGELTDLEAVIESTECTLLNDIEEIKRKLKVIEECQIGMKATFECLGRGSNYKVQNLKNIASDLLKRAEEKRNIMIIKEMTLKTEREVPNAMRMEKEIQEQEEKQIEGHVPNWKQALDENDTVMMQTLLNNDSLPSQKHVQRAYGLFKEEALTRDMINAITLKICDYIKTKSAKINTVSVCYKADDQEQVVFVAMANTEIGIDFEYEVKVCHPEGYSKEGSFVTYHDERRKKKFTPEESKDILATIQEHSSELFEKHSNLQIIDGCSVKSQGYQTKSFKIDNKQTCIVLYVNAKGLIPLHEKRFPEQLLIPGTSRSISVDVREGGMRVFGKPNEFHQHLKMGCEITDGGHAGTAGGFFEKEGKSYCLTSAHVFFGNERFRQTLRTYGRYKREDDSAYDILVYQNEGVSDKKIGVVTEAILTEGNDKNAGIDVAFIELTEANRLPIDGSFPDGNYQRAGFSVGQPMVYTTGKVYDQTSFWEQTDRNKEVVKYGSQTEVTRGTFDLEGPCVRSISFDHEGLRLKNQLTVLSVGNQFKNPFAVPGDSGALVFAKHRGRLSDLRVVGIIEGVMENEKIVVTPIWDIFDRFGMSIHEGLKKFDYPLIDANCNDVMETSPSVGCSNEERYQAMEDTIQKLIDRVDTLEQTLEQRIDVKLDQSMQQNAANFETIRNMLQTRMDTS